MRSLRPVPKVALTTCVVLLIAIGAYMIFNDSIAKGWKYGSRQGGGNINGWGVLLLALLLFIVIQIGRWGDDK